MLCPRPCARRTILVDDTPLAFLHQPENGVPVLGFRGDPDDMLLMEAVLPLVQVSFPPLAMGRGLSARLRGCRFLSGIIVFSDVLCEYAWTALVRCRSGHYRSR